VIIDSSALIAILRAEPDARRFADSIASATSKSISAANYFETAIVIDRGGDPVASRRLDELLRKGEIGIEPFTREQAEIARDAYRDFGKGSGHRAQLNFGDCLAYALAKDKGEPLLFKGDDFGHTDVEVCS
jgi:ribonuclease VapC